MLIFGRKELGWRWIVVLVALWTLLLILVVTVAPGSCIFISIQAVIVIVMMFKIFGTDLPWGL